jgi:hypothetical protein
VTGLIILNGRTEGDLQGAPTFFADGMDRKSVIDYALATPSLLNTPGVKLRVTPKHDCPLRPGGKKFDHMPVTLHIPDAALWLSKDAISTPAAGKPSPKVKWKDNHAQIYARAPLSVTQTLTDYLTKQSIAHLWKNQRRGLPVLLN